MIEKFNTGKEEIGSLRADCPSDIHIGSSGKTNKKRTQKVGTKEQELLFCRYQ